MNLRPTKITLIVLSVAVFCGPLNPIAIASHIVSLSEDVIRTKHNLIANPDIQAVGTTDVCVFCHTPHGGSRVDPDSSAPLWNRMLPDETGFSMYSGSTSPHFEASNSGFSPKGVSLACLSCHDGTIALDALVNAPGSGGFQPANLQPGIGPGVSTPDISFIGTGIVDTDSTLREGFRDSTDMDITAESPRSGGIHDTVTGGGGVEGAEPFPNLSRDLVDDHPVSMEVPASRFNSIGGKEDSQFRFIGDGSDLDGGEDGVDVMYIRRSDQLNWPSDKRDRLRAYPSTSITGSYYIECASCHNPHTPRVSFLRLPSGSPGLVMADLTPTSAIDRRIDPGDRTWAQNPNASSAICVSCHQK